MKPVKLSSKFINVTDELRVLLDVGNGVLELQWEYAKINGDRCFVMATV